MYVYIYREREIYICVYILYAGQSRRAGRAGPPKAPRPELTRVHIWQE